MSISHRIPTDPDTGIPDLVKNLADDSKRLLGDEVRLAKLEMRESVKQAGKGGLWLGLAFGIGVVALVALTILLAALIGRIANHNYWVGALVTGVVELVLAIVLFRKGARAMAEPSYTLEQTRAEAKQTATWVKREVRAG